MGRATSHRPVANWPGRPAGSQLICTAATTIFTAVHLAISIEDEQRLLPYFGLIPAQIHGTSFFYEIATLSGGERADFATTAYLNGFRQKQTGDQTTDQKPSQPKIPPRRGFGRVRASLRKFSARSRSSA